MRNQTTLFFMANQTILIEIPRTKVEVRHSLQWYYFSVRPQPALGSACRGVRFATFEDWADGDNF